MNSRYQWSLVLALIACLSGTMSYGMQPVAQRAASRYAQPTLSRWYNSLWRPAAQVPQPSYYRPDTWYGRLYDRFRPAERLPLRGDTYQMLRYKAQKGQEEAKKTVEKAKLLEALRVWEAKGKADLKIIQDKLRERGLGLMRAQRDVRLLKDEPSSVKRELGLLDRGISVIANRSDFHMATVQRDLLMKALENAKIMRRKIIE
jgi:hypothetical protein